MTGGTRIPLMKRENGGFPPMDPWYQQVVQASYGGLSIRVGCQQGIHGFDESGRRQSPNSHLEPRMRVPW
jgi:hypothetical protein